MYDNIDIYNKKIEHNNMIYSIDKIRLKTYICYSEFKELEFFIKTFYSDNIKKFWISDKINAFHYNYNIEREEGKSFYFSFMHNSEDINFNKDNKNYNFTIEFNPNKLRDDILILHILHSFPNWLLRSFDLAIDIPINILDIIIDKSLKRKINLVSYGGDNLTYYLGSKDNDGSLKIYNKKVESNLNIVGHLTRIEITRKYDDFDLKGIKSFKFGNKFLPNIYLNQYVFSFSDITKKDKTLLALLYAVQSGFPINDLSRVYKDKIKKLLEGSSKLIFDEKIARSSSYAMHIILFCSKR